MRKWVVLMDIVLLVTALAILLIDYKIKEDIVNQAKALQGVIDGQGTKAADSSPAGIPGDLLRGDDSNHAAVASKAPAESGGRRNRPSKGSSTGSAGSSRGNDDSGIPAESE